MRHQRGRTAVALLALCALVACTADDDREEAPPEPSGTPLPTGLDVCSLVDQEVVAAVIREQGDAGEPSDPSESLFVDRPTFVTCAITAGPLDAALSWSVRDPAVVSVPAFDEFTLPYRYAEIDLDVTEVGGSEAQLSTLQNDDGTVTLQVGFEHQGLQVLVRGDRLADDRSDRDALDVVLDIAELVRGALDGRAPELVDLGPAPCPGLDEPSLIEALDGEPLLARGGDGEEHYWCAYQNDRFAATFSVEVRDGDREFFPSNPSSGQTRHEFAGEPVWVNTGPLGSRFELSSIRVVLEERCELRVTLYANDQATFDQAEWPAEDLMFDLVEAWHETADCVAS